MSETRFVACVCGRNLCIDRAIREARAKALEEAADEWGSVVCDAIEGGRKPPHPDGWLRNRAAQERGTK